MMFTESIKSILTEFEFARIFRLSKETSSISYNYLISAHKFLKTSGILEDFQEMIEISRMKMISKCDDKELSEIMKGVKNDLKLPIFEYYLELFPK